MADQSTEQAIAEIWQLFKETDAKFKETDAKFKETDAKFKETDAKFKETDTRLDKRIGQLEGLFGNQWGRLIESLVEPGLLQLFQQRGIPVHNLYSRAKAQRNGSQMEIDFLLANNTQVIAIEAKSALSVDDVNEFLDDLNAFFKYFPRYNGCQLYGGVAGLDIASDVARYAYRRGLFVISISGNDMVRILNNEQFRPRNFG